MVGGDTLERSFGIVKPGATILSIKGEGPEGLAAEHGASFHPFFMQPNGGQLSEIASLITSGAVEPVLDCTYPLDGVAEAYRFAQAGGPNGKAAIAIR